MPICFEPVRCTDKELVLMNTLSRVMVYGFTLCVVLGVISFVLLEDLLNFGLGGVAERIGFASLVVSILALFISFLSNLVFIAKYHQLEAREACDLSTSTSEEKNQIRGESDSSIV